MELNINKLDDTGVQQLFLDYPLPLVLMQPALGEEYVNRRFEERFRASLLSDDALCDFAQNDSDTPLPLLVPRRTSGNSDVLVRRLPLSKFTLLVFDDIGGDAGSDAQDDMSHRLDELKDINVIDSLTGVWNQLPLERSAELEMTRCKRYQQSVSLIKLNVDGFKQINEQYGHAVGDNVLKQLVRQIKGQLRNTDTLFRWSGDEFVVLVSSCGCRAAAGLAEKLRTTLLSYSFAGAGQITLSFGVAEYVPGEDLLGWMERVDRAIYEAKQQGRNRVVVDPGRSADVWLKDGSTSLVKLTWYEHYESGDGTIDAQHKLLFELANELIRVAMNDLPVDEWRPKLDSLINYVIKHFKDEEAILNVQGYGDIERHKKMHANLIADALVLKEEALSGVLPVGRLFEFVVNDVVARHILGEDRDYFELFNQ